jgi:hypothetical protein
LGWANSSLDTLPPEPPIASTSSQAMIKSEQKVNGFEMWADRELQAAQGKVYSGRLSDSAEDEEDVYKIVLSSDIRPFLFASSDPFALIYSYLQFLGCRYWPLGLGSSELASNTRQSIPASFWPLEAKHEVFQVIGGEAMEPTRRPLTDLKLYDVRFPFLPEMLFPSTSAVPWLNSAPSLLFPGDSTHIRNSLAFLYSHKQLDSHLQAYYIAFEFCQNPKAAVKLAKTMLSHDPSNLSLWNAYAQLEWSRRKFDEARKVWIQTLSRFGEETETSTLWATWARCEMEQDLDSAARILVLQTLPPTDLQRFQTLELTSIALDSAQQVRYSRSFRWTPLIPCSGTGPDLPTQL